MDAKEKSIETLKEIKKILDKHDIYYWIDEGTLLGAVREKKLIEWDHDIDLAIWYKDIDKLSPIFHDIETTGVNLCFFEYKKHIKMVDKGYEIDINLYHIQDDKAVRLWHVSNKLGRVLDYFIWTTYLKNPEKRKFNVPFFITKSLVKLTNILPEKTNKKIRKKLEKTYEKKGCRLIQRVTVPSHFFKELTTLEFYKEQFKVPKKTEEYLEYRYGKDWRIPKRNYVFYKDDKSVVDV
jgi:lipopolysaccharide cholinephosphotransferase